MTTQNLSDDLRWAQLDRYLAGDSPSEEAESVRRWLADNPGHYEMLTMVRTIRESAVVPPAMTPDEAWERAANKLAIDIVPADSVAAATSRTGVHSPSSPDIAPHSAARGKLERFRYSRWARVGFATSMAMLFLAVAYMGAYTAQMARHKSPSPVPAVENAEYTTVRGQRATIRLRDGSLVTLAPETRLTFATKGNVRYATLVGQAQFLVTNAERSPFIVTTNSVETRVLGTEFTVRSYPDESEQQVAVASGKVAVGDLVLVANDIVTIPSGESPRVIHGADVQALTAWADGKLVFRGTPLARVAAELRRWYDLDIRVEDPSLLSRQLHATIVDDAPPAALDLLARALDVRVERHGQTVIISAK